MVCKDRISTSYLTMGEKQNGVNYFLPYYITIYNLLVKNTMWFTKDEKTVNKNRADTEELQLSTS